MGTIKEPQPVKLVCPTLAVTESCFERAESILQEEFGPIDLTSATWDFDFTDYYSSEMGSGLRRRIYSFRRLINPADLPEIKMFTNKQEDKITEWFKKTPGRAINLDPGYICGGKLVMATTKDYSHRIYLNKGILAEVTLEWKRNAYQPLRTTYPDYKTPAYREFFAIVRTIYLEQQKKDKRH